MRERDDAPTSGLMALRAKQGGEAGRGEQPAGTTRRLGWLTLPLKTTLMLLGMLIAVVAACGGISVVTARTILQSNMTTQVEEFAFGVAAALPGEDDVLDPEFLRDRLERLSDTRGVDFAMVTDGQMHPVGGYVRDGQAWSRYRQEILTNAARLNGRIGVVGRVGRAGAADYVVATPLFATGEKGRPGALLGYLHVAMDGTAEAAQVRYLEGYVLLASVALVLLAVPLAGGVARHITVPIRRLAEASRALAGGGAAAPIQVQLARADELGQLAEAFNQMSATLHAQREDIYRANQRLERKVQERTEELERVNAQLKAEMAEKEDFLRAVSHDLNAPLRNIAGMAKVLLNKYGPTLPPDGVQRLERIQKNVDVESELLNELLELSRIRSRREKMERVDLQELVSAVAEGFSGDFETRGLSFRLAGRLPTMRCERARLRQVFQNLIDNAIKYMGEAGAREIGIAARWEARELVFSVRDTGMGIAAEDMPQLFRIFRRAKNASMLNIPGKGVGLAYVKSIVETYGGRLWAESELGKGTTFWMAFPLKHFESRQEVAA